MTGAAGSGRSRSAALGLVGGLCRESDVSEATTRDSLIEMLLSDVLLHGKTAIADLDDPPFEDWPSPYNWASFIPKRLQAMWPSLCEESRLVACLFGCRMAYESGRYVE